MRKRSIKRVIFISLLSSSILTVLYLSQMGEIDFFFKRSYENTPVSIGEYGIESTKPERLYIKEDAIYVYDIMEKQIKQYLKEGKPASVVMGDSLHNKQFGIVSNFELDSGIMEIADVRNKGIFLYDQKRKSIRFDSIGIFSQGISLGNKTVLVSYLDTSKNDIGFKKFDLKNGSSEPVNMPIKRYEDAGFANDGFFKRNGNKFLYVFYRLGQFIVFDSSLKYFKCFPTIDKYKTPPITAKLGHKTYISNKSIAINGNAALDANNAYIISLVRSNYDKNMNVKGAIIDVYDNTTGIYKYSYTLKNLPGKVRDIYISKGILYVLAGNLVRMFKL